MQTHATGGFKRSFRKCSRFCLPRHWKFFGDAAKTNLLSRPRFSYRLRFFTESFTIRRNSGVIATPGSLSSRAQRRTPCNPAPPAASREFPTMLRSVLFRQPRFPFLGRGHRAITVVEIPPRGRKSPFTSAHTGFAQRTTSSNTRLTIFS